MSDTTIISEAVTDWQQGHPITDLQARVIASAWHGGQASALYSLASCGAIRGDLESEIVSVIVETGDETEELAALGAYVGRAGERGPVDGWSDLHW